MWFLPGEKKTFEGLEELISYSVFNFKLFNILKSSSPHLILRNFVKSHILKAFLLTFSVFILFLNISFLQYTQTTLHNSRANLVRHFKYENLTEGSLLSSLQWVLKG